jgi:phosphatidate cytidylyltransferase
MRIGAVDRRFLLIVSLLKSPAMRSEKAKIKNSVPYGKIIRSTFRERFLPAVLLIAAVILALQFLPGWGFFAVLQLVILLSLLEFYNLFYETENPPYRMLGLLVALIFSTAFLFDVVSLEMVVLAALFLAAIYPLFFFKIKSSLSPFAGAMALTLLGPVYICLTINFFHLLREERGSLFIYFLIIIIVCGDTGAYFVGKFWGKSRMAPNASPKKTWEGAVAGLFFSGLGAVLVRAVLIPDLNLGKAVLIAVSVHAVAQISDLLESLFKRSAGKKDSSNILGGHGGFLDRIDSFILATPFFYYFLKFVRLD